MNERIRRGINDPSLAIKYFKKKLFNLLFFDVLYNKVDNFVLNYKGIKIEFSTKDKHSKHWFFPRYDNGKMHEPVISKMIMDSIKNSKIFVDVGTYLGYYTCLIGKIFPKSIVYGFEIDENVFDLLNENIKLNNLSNVKPYNLAISDKDGLVKFSVADSLDSSLTFTTDIEKNQEYISVKSVSLDNFFKKQKNKPDVIKIDVEGAEMLVLKGMKELLEKRDLILFLEIHGNKLDKFNTTSKEIISFIIDKGYKVYEIENHRSQNIDEEGRLRELDKNSIVEYNTMTYIARD
jgi:FkbM family methyltransferase